MEQQEGYILLHRKIIDWEWYKKPKTAHLFRHCLLKANYADKKWHDITIKRGQFVTSRSKLAFETGLSEQEVRTALKNLISTNDLTSEPSTQNTIITVVNYDLYQKNNQRTRRKITTTNKERYINKLIYLSQEEREILKNYLLELNKNRKNKIDDIDAYIRRLIENGDCLTKLEKAKKRLERKKAKESIPPPKKNEEPPADIQILRDNLKFIKPKGEKKNG